MGTQISWSIEGDKQLSRVLEGVENKLKDPKPAFKQSAEKLIGVFQKEVFDTQGAVINERWARLSPYTVAQKARQGYPLDPLIRTGRMRRSFESLVESDRAVIYNTAEYFKYHQSNQPRQKLPRRVMMKLGNQQKEIVIKVFQEHILRASGRIK